MLSSAVSFLVVDHEGNSLLFFLVNVAVLSHQPHCTEGWPVKTAETRKVSKRRGVGSNLPDTLPQDNGRNVSQI